MIKYVKGNILNDNSTIIVIPVNCMGVMGKGLALQFKRKYPFAYKYYKELCNQHLIEVGSNLQSYNTDIVTNIFLPTKKHWINPSELQYVDVGLRLLREYIIAINLTQTIYNKHNYKSIAIPALGCGCGGLDWKDIKILIEKHLSDLDNDITVYCPIDEEE